MNCTIRMVPRAPPEEPGPTASPQLRIRLAVLLKGDGIVLGAGGLRLEVPAGWRHVTVNRPDAPAASPVLDTVFEEAGSGDALTYYRSADRVHHVPKLKLVDLVLKSLG